MKKMFLLLMFVLLAMNLVWAEVVVAEDPQLFVDVILDLFEKLDESQSLSWYRKYPDALVGEMYLYLTDHPQQYEAVCSTIEDAWDAHQLGSETVVLDRRTIGWIGVLGNQRIELIFIDSDLSIIAVVEKSGTVSSSIQNPAKNTSPSVKDIATPEPAQMKETALSENYLIVNIDGEQKTFTASKSHYNANSPWDFISAEYECKTPVGSRDYNLFIAFAVPKAGDVYDSRDPVAYNKYWVTLELTNRDNHVYRVRTDVGAYSAQLGTSVAQIVPSGASYRIAFTSQSADWLEYTGTMDAVLLLGKQKIVLTDGLFHFRIDEQDVVR